MMEEKDNEAQIINLKADSYDAWVEIQIENQKIVEANQKINALRSRMVKNAQVIDELETIKKG